MTIVPDISGQAALTVCESLLLALNDCKILPEEEIRGVLEDAVSTHRNAADAGQNEDFNNAVADIIESMIEGGGAVRRRQEEGPIPAV